MQAGTPNIDWLQQHISLDADLGHWSRRSRRWSQQRRRLLAAVPQWRTCAVLQPGRAGRLFGISPHTTRAELQRAVFELAFAIVDALQGYPQGGELYLTGGGAASATAELSPTVPDARWSPAPLTN